MPAGCGYRGVDPVLDGVDFRERFLPHTPLPFKNPPPDFANVPDRSLRSGILRRSKASFLILHPHARSDANAAATLFIVVIPLFLINAISATF